MTIDSAITVSSTNSLQVNAALQEVINLTLQTIAPSSRRVYRQTFDKWTKWAASNGIDAADLRPVVVLEFLRGQNVTKATQQRQLAAFRKLAQMAVTLRGTDADQRVYNALKLVKADGMNAEGERGGIERVGRALAAADVYELLKVWRGSTPLQVRNLALTALLIYTGIRRAEAADLKWGDLDLDAGLITVRHGKGDKARTVAILSSTAIDALRALKAALPAARQFVFCAVRKGGKWGNDKPITGTDVYRVMAATAEAAGIDFKPHDLRRTLITSALAAGTSLADIQQQAGHARGETTLRYAKAAEAAELHNRIKLGFGR